ncbi:Six-hairpin glycosidase-like protein [Flagelloscypha sp. PMI_526]|nr:Six-hairpin glycosidase-like protein [Flagelloscypha sp. PMI_526]
MHSSLIALLLVSPALAVLPFRETVPFDIEKVAEKAESLPTHSWEFGTTVEALLELYDADVSVFGSQPFPAPSNLTDIKGLNYASEKIIITKGKDALSPADGSIGDPASLGIGAYLLGKQDDRFKKAAENQLRLVVEKAPRWTNGAISHRANVAELWADFMYMAPPFIAFVGADTGNETLLEEAYNQCANYREVLSSHTSGTGLWKHIMGPDNSDHGHWSTGQGWATAGMLRVLASIQKAPGASQSLKAKATKDITSWIKAMVDSVMEATPHRGLVRNYVDNEDPEHGYGEFSGTSMLASVVFRMAVMSPETFNSSYVEWATNVFDALAGKDEDGVPYVTKDGIVRNCVDPLDWKSTKPFNKGSPEGQAMVTLAYSAFRDCVDAGRCSSLGAGDSDDDKAVASSRVIRRHHGRRSWSRNAHNAV